MSMSDQGSSTLACVCRCSSGLRSWSRPVIHIFAGLNVCIQAMMPMHASSAFASSITRRIAPASVSTGLATTRAGTSAEAPSVSETWRDWSATCRSTSSP